MKIKGISEAQKVSKQRNFRKMQLMGMLTNFKSMKSEKLLTKSEEDKVNAIMEQLAYLIGSWSENSKAIVSHYKKKQEKEK